MRLSKKQHIENILNVIEQHHIMFLNHIFGYYKELSRSSFYNLGLDKLDTIKTAIIDNRSRATGFMINKWIGSENPTLNIAAYKLICTEEERQKLAKDYSSVELTGKNGKPLDTKIEVEIIDNSSQVRTNENPNN